MKSRRALDLSERNVAFLLYTKHVHNYMLQYREVNIKPKAMENIYFTCQRTTFSVVSEINEIYVMQMYIL